MMLDDSLNFEINHRSVDVLCKDRNPNLRIKQNWHIQFVWPCFSSIVTHHLKD